MLENKGFFIGNLAKDAEIRQTREGKSYITFTLAVNSKFRDKTNTQYIECTRWGDVANIAGYLRKGTLIAVEGRLGCHAYMGRDNKPYASIDLNVFELQLLSSKRD